MERKSRLSKYRDLREQITSQTTGVDNEALEKAAQSQKEEVRRAVEAPAPAKSEEKAPDADIDELIRQAASYEKEKEEKKPAEEDSIDQLIRDNEELLGISHPQEQQSEVPHYWLDDGKKGQEKAPSQEEANPSFFTEKKEPAEKEPVKKESTPDLHYFSADDILKAPEESEGQTEPDIDLDLLEGEESDVNIPDNFLDQTIEEAKRYSMDKGERTALNTTTAIIDELTKRPQEEEHPAAGGANSAELDKTIEDLLNGMDLENVETASAPAEEPAPAQPEEPEKQEAAQAQPAQQEEPAPTQPAAEPAPEEEPSEAQPAEEEPAQPAEYFEDTARMSAKAQGEEAPQEEDVQPEEPFRAYEEEPAEEEAQPEDAEVTRTLNDLTNELNKETVLRSDLEQQTKQMKMEIGQMGDDIDTVTHQVNRTNKVLNFVLIVLIITLFAILIFIGYWALKDRGYLYSGYTDPRMVAALVRHGPGIL